MNRVPFNFARLAIGSATLLVFLFLYLPIGVIIAFSFSKSNIVSYPITGWTLHWYQRALFDPEGARLRDALWNSIKVASAATLIASVLGSLGAYAVQRYHFFGRNLFRIAVVIPLLLPGCVTGIAMLLYFQAVGIKLGLIAVTIGHATFGFPVVFNTVAARVARLPRSIEEAAADLGANPVQGFLYIGFPSIFSALLSGALLAFTLSLDEIIVTFFLISGRNTLPYEIYTRMRQSFEPDNLAIVTLILFVSVALVLMSQYLARRQA